MPFEYVVAQGEHFSGICARYGFPNYETVWRHPNNGPLRLKRKNPDILFPGDVVFIPDPELEYEQCATEKRHLFRKRSGRLRLNLRLVELLGDALKNEQCLLALDGAPNAHTTSTDGTLEIFIPFTADSARLDVGDRQFEIHIGHLDPVEEISGQQARLTNLGYQVSGESEADLTRLRHAIEEFQCDHGLLVTGVLDPLTKTKLQEVYGS